MKNSNSRLRFFFFALFFLFFLTFVGTIKAFLLVVFCYGAGLFLFTSLGLPEVLFSLLLFTLPFEKGLRDWIVPVVPPGPELWAPGYSFYFGITLKLILAYGALALLALSRNARLPSNKKALFMLFLFFLLAAASTIASSEGAISFMGLLRLLQGGIIFLLGSYFFQKSPTMRNYAETLFVAFLFFFGFIGLLQYFSGQPLGLFLEDSLGVRAFGYITSDTGPLYRVSGLLGHPTFFGTFLSLLLPVSVALWIEKQKNNRPDPLSVFLPTTIFVGFTATIATLSRSAWLALAVCVPFFLWKLHVDHLQRLTKAFWIAMIVGALFASVLFGQTLMTRASTFTDLASLSSGRIRLDLIEQTGMIVRESPLFGTGLNLFTRAMNVHDLPPELKGFMYPVHNTFLLFFSELGIPAGLLFIIFVGYCLFSSWEKAKRRWVSFGFWLGAWTFVVNAQFHTLFNQDPTLDLFLVFLGYLSAV
ncbi:O-antigen ligase family protein [Candidatus Gottesmanbacteria bacterium]|nr:O-antigen ligase family protein [Candidatus Gottesmanbacteria bacterium]